MSGSEDQGGAGRREVAYRLFAAEFEDADFSYSESDEERAPNYVISPTGGRVNRLFVVGVLTEVENASEDVLRARIVDPTGAFVVYAGQYQPEAQAFFERADPPMFVAITGKARTFQPEDSDVTYTSIRPENVNEVDAETRDRWNVGTARQTLTRVRTMAHALQRDERGDELRAALEADGIDTGLAAGIPLAIDHYGTTPAYLDAIRSTAVGAAEVVAGERGEVDSHSASPDAPGEADLAGLAAMDLAPNVGGETTDFGGAVDTDSGLEADAPAAESSGSATTETTSVETSTDTSAGESETQPVAESDPASESDTDVGTATASAGESTTTAGSEADDDTAVESRTGTGTDSGSALDSAPESDLETAPESDLDADVDDGPSTDDGGGDDDPDEFEPGEFELDEDEREAIESEYGTDFQTGSEVGEPGEAGIETPDPDELTEEDGASRDADEASIESDDSTSESPSLPDSTPADDPDDSGDSAVTDTASEEDVDIDIAVIDAMDENDDGDGAHADDIVEAVTARTGADAGAVRDAIQDALMEGRCYEPDDDVYKTI